MKFTDGVISQTNLIIECELGFGIMSNETSK